MSDDRAPSHAVISQAEEGGTLKSVVVAPVKNSQSILALALVIAALFTVVLILSFHNRTVRDSSVGADVETLEVGENFSGLDIDFAPDGTEVESGVLIGRIKRDAETLAALVETYEEALAAKDHELGLKNSERAGSEAYRQTLTAEMERLKSELQAARAGGSDADLLRTELGEIKIQRDGLITDLSAARSEVEALQVLSAARNYDDLNRRFEETLRAKEFFEGRVKELEGGAPTVPPAPPAE